MLMYSGKVTSQKMIEREIGYRGSKSERVTVSVKEQRVDGSWQGSHGPCLRCTLTGFVRNHQAKVHSNQINKALYSTVTSAFKLNPWFVTGFSDAEGSFSILIQRNTKYLTGYRVKAIFAIGLHKKDLNLLEGIKGFFGVGKIHVHGKDSLQYRVESVKDLQVIISHFDNYSLITKKLCDYLLFKQALFLINNGEHLTSEGLNKLIGIKASLNLGLSDDLKETFPKFIKVDKPEYVFKCISDPHWVAGFTSGDGGFSIKTSSSSTNKLGNRVRLRFFIGLHIRDLAVILGLISLN